MKTLLIVATIATTAAILWFAGCGEAIDSTTNVINHHQAELTAVMAIQ